LPTAIEGAGVFTDIAEDDPFRQLMTTFRPVGGRLGRPEDVADAAEYIASDLASWVSGQHLLVSGGALQ
jgi:3-oxoacyl-[acyl-carrier protein] reductase